MTDSRNKTYAYIETTRCRYDRVEYRRVLRDRDQGRKDDGYILTYCVQVRNGYRTIVEFISDKWITRFRKYQ